MVKVGPRLWKTGLAVALTVMLVRLTGHRYEVYGAIAAALAVAPSANHSLRTAGLQLSANVLGGIVGAAAMFLFGPNPLVIGAVVVGVLLLCQQLNLKSLSQTAVTVSLFVMAPHTDSINAYVLWRLVSVAIGSVVGTAVNALVLPPNYWPETVARVIEAGALLDSFILGVADRLDHPGAMTKAEILQGVAKVDRAIAEARRLFQLLSDSRRGDARLATLERSVKVLASLLERIQIIHKAALTAERASGFAAEAAEMRDALQALVTHRQMLYRRLLDEAVSDTLPAELLAIEQRFESPSALPVAGEDVEAFFRLYRMRTGVSYMANRLGRLSVAMDGATEAAVAGLVEAVS